jgi:hypothetical protein
MLKIKCSQPASALRCMLLLSLSACCAPGDYRVYSLARSGTLVHGREARKTEYISEPLRQQIADYIESHRDLQPEIQKGLLAGTVIDGMNREEIKLLLGEPDGISGGNAEKWMYYTGHEGFGSLRWIGLPLVPLLLLPTGHEYYELIFEDDALKQIRFATTVCV